jgi:hypothetical protein
VQLTPIYPAYAGVTPTWVLVGTRFLFADLSDWDCACADATFRYMGGAGVPSDHLVTPIKKTDMGGKVFSCGYESAEMYQ